MRIKKKIICTFKYNQEKKLKKYRGFHTHAMY